MLSSAYEPREATTCRGKDRRAGPRGREPAPLGGPAPHRSSLTAITATTAPPHTRRPPNHPRTGPQRRRSRPGPRPPTHWPPAAEEPAGPHHAPRNRVSRTLPEAHNPREATTRRVK